MTRRYYVPDLRIGGGPLSLPDAEAQHAVRVMRVQVGEEIELFDGKGHESKGIVTAIRRNECECETTPALSVSREPSAMIHLGIALPKPDRARELLERLTELGVCSVTPLVAERSQRPPSDSLIERLQRTVIEACKQSGRNQLLNIHPTCSATDFFASLHSGTKLIAHTAKASVTLSTMNRAETVVAAVGPEGGWTDQEYEGADSHQFHPLSLGPRIYRIETAAVAIAAVLIGDQW